MQKLIHNENDINSSNRQSSTLDTNKNNIIFYKNGTYFSFGKDNSLNNKLTPTTSSFNFKENIRKSFDATNLNNNSFLNKKRKLMTSEELELEQIEREREEVRKMMKKNMDLYYRTKSGTTRIVSKIKDDIYNTNNISKNIILNNYLKNNNTNINNNNTQLPNMNKNITNSYAMNFMKEKGINKTNDIKKNEINDKKIENSNNSKPEQIIEIINTDINTVSVKNKEDDKKDDIIDLFEEKEEIEEVDDKAQENEVNDTGNEEKASNSAIKTPNKESSYLTKIKKLGSMSKLSLCNKIQKYTEICQEVLKEQENKEGGKDKTKKEEKKGKEKNKKISKNKKNNKK
jgi:hypothetical protein